MPAYHVFHVETAGSSLDLSLSSKLPENQPNVENLSDNNGKDLKNIIEADNCPPVVQDTKKKDSNLNHPEEHIPDELKCPYCDKTFENVTLIQSWHVKQSHQKKKKEYFLKIRRNS